MTLRIREKALISEYSMGEILLNKRIMLLGGNYFQMTAMKAAKELGCYVIYVDYLPENPAHKFADEYHNVSTMDEKAFSSWRGIYRSTELYPTLQTSPHPRQPMWRSSWACREIPSPLWKR